MLKPMNEPSAFTKTRPKVSQRIADDLRLRIARGKYGAGSHLPPEFKLMEQYGASRPTRREAIRILEAESLVVTSGGGPKGA
ncbi:MAG: GntR family transcriptional regulator, partial [Steroidobacteraceae bacterium]